MSDALLIKTDNLTTTFVIKPIYSNIVLNILNNNSVRFKQTHFTEKKIPLNAVEKGMYNILQIVKITA